MVVGQEARELDRLDGGARRLFGARMRVVAFTARYNPALQAVPALGQVGVLALGGWLALQGNITLGTFLAFATYLAALVSPVRQLAALLVSQAIAAAGVPVSAMKKKHKVGVVLELKHRGFFMLRDAVDMISESLAVTRFTIYNYLNEIAAEEPVAED